MRRARVTLVRPAFSPDIYGTVYGNLPKYREVRPPLGLAYLAASLERSGHSVAIIDGEPALLDLAATVEAIVATEPDFVGTTSTTPEFRFASEILREVKRRRPGVVTIAGGSHVSALPEYTVERNPHIGHVVVAEGEKSILRVVGGTRDRVIRARGPEDEIDPNANPWPARHLLDYRKYAYADPVLGIARSDAIESQRSCPYQCHFCFRGVGTRVRKRDVTGVIDELHDTYRRHHLNHVIWFDDTFTMDRRRTEQICDGILDRGIKLNMYCFTAANTLRPELLQAMKAAGFTMITLGIESGNAEILKSVGKAATPQHYVDAYVNMDALGIETRGSVILGHPYENHATIWDTIIFVTDGLRLQRLGVNILMPFPGTRTWFQTLQRDGIRFAHGTDVHEGINDDWSAYRRWGNAVIETCGDTGATGGGLSRADLIFYQRYLLMRFYTHPRVVERADWHKAHGNTNEYFHRPIVDAQRELLAFNEREKTNPHRFSNGMTINEVVEDLRRRPEHYAVTRALDTSRRKGIGDAAPQSFAAAPAVALPAAWASPRSRSQRSAQGG